MTADKKLRIQSLAVQVTLAWDDGDELTPGPGLQPVNVSLSQARAMLDGLPAEVEKLAEEIREGAERAESPPQ